MIFLEYGQQVTSRVVNHLFVFLNCFKNISGCFPVTVYVLCETFSEDFKEFLYNKVLLNLTPKQKSTLLSIIMLFKNNFNTLTYENIFRISIRSLSVSNLTAT